MGFIIILILTTLSIAGSAAFFSIYGLAAIFSGSFWPVVLMASSLEAGKLVAASYVYRYRKKIGFLMKTYLVIAILILMMITSVGIFGFLSAAYQQDILPLEEMETRIELYDERKLEIERLRVEANGKLTTLEEQVTSIPPTHSTNRRKMRQSQQGDRDQINVDLKRLSTELQTATTEQHELKTQIIQQRVHTGPIIFIAKAFDQEVDDATKWMVLLIIFAFDPLAVMLTIGANIAILDRRRMHGEFIEEEELKPEHEHDEVHSGEPIDDITDIADLPDSFLDELDPERTVIINRAAPSEITIGEIRELLEEVNSKNQPTSYDISQKNQLEQMLRRREVTERVRNPNKK